MFLSLFLFPLIGSIKNKSYPNKLSIEEEEKYLFELSHGIKEARDKLIEHNLRLVAHIVKKYSNTLEDKDDLLSIGTMGLIKAIDTYKLLNKTKLSTYASRCIENEILMKLRSNKKRRNDSWLYSTIGYDKEGNDIKLIDIIKDNQEPIENLIILDEEVSFLKKSLTVLSERELSILELRYGLNGKEVKTQKVISELYSISRSYVSRIEKRALLKLYMNFKENKKT